MITAKDAEIFLNVVSGADEDRPNENQDGEGECSVEIFSVNTGFQNTKCGEFIGSCIDSGSHRTLIGHKQSEAYTSLTGIVQLDKVSERMPKYKFGELTHTGLGKIKVRIPIREYYFFDV